MKSLQLYPIVAVKAGRDKVTIGGATKGFSHGQSHFPHFSCKDKATTMSRVWLKWSNIAMAVSSPLKLYFFPLLADRRFL